MTKPGTEYELFVKDLIEAIMDSESIVGQKNINIQHRVKLDGKSGIEREFDIYWEFEIGGFNYKKVIECKDYNSKVSVEKIDALKGKLEDFNNIQGIFATKLGYQQGAFETAKNSGIELLIVRNEDEEKDFYSKDGTPLVREIKCNLKFYLPLEFIKKDFEFDTVWLKQNNIRNIKINCLENEIRIISDSKKLNMNLHEYFTSFNKQNDTDKEIIEEKEINFNEDTFLVKDETRYKINSIKITYRIPPCFTKEIKIKPMVKGVVEYLISQKKKIVFSENNKDYVKDIS